MADERRFILEFREGGGYVSLNRRYHPPEVVRHEDPLDADRYRTSKSALDNIASVHKQRPGDYRTRKLHVELR